jgi:hypothetical protein
MGYFVVRGIPYSFGRYSVTDLDLWLYGLTGGFRERINVDIKNKKTPQAIERILWTLGVMQLLRLDRCIVVTTDKNPAVLDFGRRSGVTVVDGRFLQEAGAGLTQERLTEEEFLNALGASDAEELTKALRFRYEAAKKRLVTHLNYDGCNLHLMGIRDSMEYLETHAGLRDRPRRLLYVLISYLLISIDYMLSRTAFMAADERHKDVDAGLRYGSAGKQRLDDFVKILNSCRPTDETQGGRVVDDIARRLRDETNKLRSDMVAEYMVRKVGPENLFALAHAFENAAFRAGCPVVADLPSELKSLVLMLTDFHEMDRTRALAW